MLTVDGGAGEGGGQIVRTSLSLAAVSGRPVRIVNVRAGRARPGLAAQHVMAARAAAAVSAGRLSGDALGSRTLEFVPGEELRPGRYCFDVAQARAGGSAGAVMLVLQTVLVPLALAGAASTLVIRGGTHLAWSPSFDYVRDAWLPALARVGFQAKVELERWGWYAAGGGQVRAAIDALGTDRPGRLEVLDPGPLREIVGRAVAARLPGHVAERMARRATALLARAGVEVRVEPQLVSSLSAGAGIFLAARDANVVCGFTALGRRGLPAEAVAEDLAQQLGSHEASGAAFDAHLADQMIAPLALASGSSRFTVERVTSHLETNAAVVEQFGIAQVSIRAGAGPCTVTVRPTGRQPAC